MAYKNACKCAGQSVLTNIKNILVYIGLLQLSYSIDYNEN